MEKCFDWINRGLKKSGIDGKFFDAVKQLYRNSESCVKLNEHLTEWFITSTGLKQGETFLQVWQASI